MIIHSSLVQLLRYSHKLRSLWPSVLYCNNLATCISDGSIDPPTASSFTVLSPSPAVAVVGLETTFYSVLEDVGVVEVCAIIYNPNISCPIAFPFGVHLSTGDNTAGM